MTEEPADWVDQADGVEEDEILDLDAEFGDDGVDAMLDTSYSPPERPPAATRGGSTLADRLAQEEPDAWDNGSEDAPDSGWDGTDSKRAGRLVSPDEGAHEDEEKDMVASDIGVDAGAATAEEAAMHVLDADDESMALDEGSTGDGTRD